MAIVLVAAGGLLVLAHHAAAGWSYRLPWEAPPDPRGAAPRVPTGDIRYHERFASKILGNERTLVVYLPPDYTSSPPDRRYPVLYMHDGQTLFDASFSGDEWHADETAERLIQAGAIEPLIIVGIHATNRRRSEYAPWRRRSDGRGGGGEHYARFVVEEVKPFVDATYRTLPGREHTVVAGSSMGGLISLYLATKYPDTFSMAGVLSPTLASAERRAVGELEAHPSALKRLRLWLYMGTAEWPSPESQAANMGEIRRLVGVCEKAGLRPGRDYVYTEGAGGEHTERAWAEQFERMLLFFVGKSR